MGLYDITHTQCYTIVYYTILYYAVLYYTILYSTILYYTILYYTILYYSMLYYIILYYTIVYFFFAPFIQKVCFQRDLYKDRKLLIQQSLYQSSVAYRGAIEEYCTVSRPREDSVDGCSQSSEFCIQ